MLWSRVVIFESFLNTSSTTLAVPNQIHHTSLSVSNMHSPYIHVYTFNLLFAFFGEEIPSCELVALFLGVEQLTGGVLEQGMCDG